MNIVILGIDLAKTLCSLVGLDRSRPLMLSTKPFCIGLPGAM
ncbi:hypothetical protein X738_30045 [Mesorhizobium sp. LNHC209A00]|nr:hypothetical protein X738_30045 [Mesorhizobium sp. LNHC209A00]